MGFQPLEASAGLVRKTWSERNNCTLKGQEAVSRVRNCRHFFCLFVLGFVFFFFSYSPPRVCFSSEYSSLKYLVAKNAFPLKQKVFSDSSKKKSSINWPESAGKSQLTNLVK